MGKTLTVEVVGDTSALSKAFGNASKQSSSFGDKVSKGAKIAASTLGGGFGGRRRRSDWDEIATGAAVAAQTKTPF